MHVTGDRYGFGNRIEKIVLSHETVNHRVDRLHWVGRRFSFRVLCSSGPAHSERLYVGFDSGRYLSSCEFENIPSEVLSRRSGSQSREATPI